MEGGEERHINDLPESILVSIIESISSTRWRNSISLVSHRWLKAERSSRRRLTLRCLASHLPTLPISKAFPFITHLDLSSLSPPYLQLPSPLPNLRLPSLSSLTLYSSLPLHLSLPPLAPLFPLLSSIKLLRYHPRPPTPTSDLSPLLLSFPLLTSIDLSQFHHWTHDLPPLLLLLSTPTSLSSLNLLTPSLSHGYDSHHLSTISTSCPSLSSLSLLCNFDPSSPSPIDDPSLLSLASHCPLLHTLHLHDASPPSSPPQHFSTVTSSSLIPLFSSLPSLHHLSLHMSRPVRGARQALQALASSCKKLTSLNLSGFSGVAQCSNLERLSLNNCGDEFSGMGWGRLKALSIHGCGGVRWEEMRRAVGAMRRTLVEVRVSRCRGMEAEGVVRAVEAIRETVEVLQMDCCSSSSSSSRWKEGRREEVGKGGRRWERLREVWLWAGVGEGMVDMEGVGLGECPRLEEVGVKVEGDCRGRRERPEGEFGLGGLRRYEGLRRVRVDCGGVVGNVWTAPGGETEVSEWERFYLKGVGELEGVEEVEYWPLHDADLNQRSVSLVGVGLLAQCRRLRSLIIHGSINQHLFSLLLHTPCLRDVRLLHDHFPTPFSHHSSSSRSHHALYTRPLPD